MKIRISANTDVGKERTNNEDTVAVCPDLDVQKWMDGEAKCKTYVPLGKLGAVSIVADGMGGANAGEVASALATETVKKCFSTLNVQSSPMPGLAIRDFLKKAVAEANNAIMKYVESEPDAVGLGTTALILWIIKNKAYIAWCGDSRCYCFNPNKGLKQLTKDHSYVQELVDNGKITKEQAFNHPDGNIITRCLGDVGAKSEPDVIACNIEKGDMFLSCSDGLCGYCDDKHIEKLMYRTFDDIDKCRNCLIDIALASGGYDNITVSLVATLPDDATTPPMTFAGKIKRKLALWFE